MGSFQFSLEVKAAARALQEQRPLPLLASASSELGEGRTRGSFAFLTRPDVLISLICNITEKLHVWSHVMVSEFCLVKAKAC